MPFIPDITYILLTIVILLSEVHCDNDSDGIDETKNKFTTVPISTPEDFIIESKKGLAQKLIRLISDAEFREERKKALNSVSPPNVHRIDDEIDPKIHIHHIFPPAIIRPLQKVIIRKLIEKVKSDPIKKLKKKLIAKAIKGTVAVGAVATMAQLSGI